MSDLQSFDGRDVRGSRIAVRNAGDGLSEAMKVEPRELHLEETIYVVMETTVKRVSYEPANKDSDDLVRTHVLSAGNATIVDRTLVEKALSEQAKKIQAARDELTGQTSIDALDEWEKEGDGATLKAVE